MTTTSGAIFVNSATASSSASLDMPLTSCGISFSSLMPWPLNWVEKVITEVVPPARQAVEPVIQLAAPLLDEAQFLFRLFDVLLRFPLHHALDQLFVFAAPRQGLLHLMHRMRPPHQCLDGCIVKLRFRLQLPWFPKHTKSIEVSADRNKR